MIVDGLEEERHDGRAGASARVEWRTGAFRLEVSMPSDFASARPDASPFLCAALLLAMRLGEDLEVRGPVSGPLLERAPRIVDLYSRWDPRLFRSRVRAAEELPAGPRAAGVGGFFSRGVDSLYAAAAPRGERPPLTHLVFSDRLEPIHTASVRAEELRLAAQAAERLGLPLVAVDTNIRELTDPIVRNWEDMAGGGLAFLATSMSGGFRRVLIPSSDGEITIGPCGTSPMLDPLFSTAEVEVEHDLPGTRCQKVAWLSRERPDLLPYLKVCFFEDRADNCGRCSKCLLTMLALEAGGVLEEAKGFPPEIDREALAAVRIGGYQPVQSFREVERALRARGGAGELADLVAAGLDRAAARAPNLRLPEDSPSFRKRAERAIRLGARKPPGPPRTTVMMPAYAAEATLRGAVDSVLCQTTGDLELVVVDDGSAVPAAEVLADIRDPRLRVVRHARNRGLSAARNTALRAARAALVSQLDADDAWEPDYLESVLPCFDDPGVGLAYSNCTILGHPTGHEDYIGDPSVHPMHEFPKIAEQNPIPCPTATMRTEAVRAVGGYARWLRQCEDYHLYMKLARAGWRFAYVDERLARYRWPEPARGMSHDPRRHELWEHAMFGSFALRHPRTPGPRRQLRVRARRELEKAGAAAQRLPRPTAPRPRLLVEPGSYAMLNLGDVAMLQVCVDRLRRESPEATIGVVTSDPDRLAAHVPDVQPVPVAGQHEWFSRRWQGGAYWPLVPASGRERAEGHIARLADRGPRAARAALRLELVARGPASDELREFAGWLRGADAVVVSGRGGTTDVFLDDALEVLEVLRTAAALGIRTAMFGQGVGPMEDDGLRRLARRVLPTVEVLTVREPRAAVTLLEGLGFRPGDVPVTGDDALELAYGLRTNGAVKNAIGVALRVAPYSGATAETAETVARVVRGAAARHGAELRAVPISLYPHEADADTLREVVDGAGREAATPREAIAEAGACRVVVAGSYHAAVFALAQGIPVVGLVASPYYRSKLDGLADLFPEGCRVVSAHAGDLEPRLAAALDEMWDAADAASPALLAAAERQIADARDAYARFGRALSNGRRR